MEKKELQERKISRLKKIALSLPIAMGTTCLVFSLYQVPKIYNTINSYFSGQDSNSQVLEKEFYEDNLI